jgi:hypothetical protein
VLSKQEPYKEYIPKIDPQQRKKKIDYHRKKIQELEIA